MGLFSLDHFVSENGLQPNRTGSIFTPPFLLKKTSSPFHQVFVHPQNQPFLMGGKEVVNREVILNSHPAESETMLPSQGRATDLYSTKAWGFDWDFGKSSQE